MWDYNVTGEKQYNKDALVVDYYSEGDLLQKVFPVCNQA